MKLGERWSELREAKRAKRLRQEHYHGARYKHSHAHEGQHQHSQLHAAPNKPSMSPLERDEFLRHRRARRLLLVILAAICVGTLMLAVSGTGGGDNGRGPGPSPFNRCLQAAETKAGIQNCYDFHY